MRAVADRDEYLSAPFGCYCGGPGYLHFFYDRELCGTVFWGRPDARGMERLAQLIEVEAPEHSPPHSAIVDTRRLTGIDPDAFQVLSSFLGPRAMRYGVNVIRQALVHPGGVVGALVQGFYDVTPAVFEEKRRFFTDIGEGLAFLGRPPSLAAEVDAAQAELSGVPSVARRLHEWLRGRPAKLTLEEAARALGLPPRSLQGQLAKDGSSFRRELNLARVELAKELLAGSDTKLSAIALDVGCGSLPHFSSLFRREAGCSPSEWRKRYRR